jgi:RNA polymerase sigma-70 factor (ECF subfamily)
MSDPDPSLNTRPSLLVCLRDLQDAEAWQTFVDTYAPLVYRHCRGRGLQDADAADVTQEVLAETVRCLRTFVYQPERGRFRDWLGTLTYRRLARFFARKGRGAGAGGGAADEVLDGTAAPPPDPEWADAFNGHVLSVALERIRPNFEPSTWRVFERVWLEQRPAPEAAGELNVPVEAVYLAKSRVLKRLREEVLLLAEDIPHFFPLD